MNFNKILYFCALIMSNNMTLTIPILAHILLALTALAIALVLLSVRILIKKDGKFSSQHISENKRMREKGIGCATSQDRQERHHSEKKLDVKHL